MKIDLLLAPGANTTELVAHAGDAGIDTLWWVDSPAVFGDPFVAMSAAATVNQTMGLGVAVVNPLSRDLLMTAVSIASVNVLTRQRVLLGVGVGHTGTSAFALGKATLSELGVFVNGVRSVLRGGDFTRADGMIERLVNPVPPWFDVDKDIPIFVAAGGPRGLRVAGRVADGVLVGGVADPKVIGRAREILASGAAEASRPAGEIEVCVTPSLAVTDQPMGENELKESLGPKSLGPALTFRRLCTEVYGSDSAVVRQLTAIEDAYQRFGAGGLDASEKQVRRLEGYMTTLEEWQRPLVTDELLDLTSIHGTVDECAARIAELAEAGVNRLILSPSPQHVVDALGLLKPTIREWNGRAS